MSTPTTAGRCPAWCNAHFVTSPHPDDSVHFGKVQTGVEGITITIEEGFERSAGFTPVASILGEEFLTPSELRQLAQALIYASFAMEPKQ